MPSPIDVTRQLPGIPYAATVRSGMRSRRCQSSSPARETKAKHPNRPAFGESGVKDTLADELHLCFLPKADTEAVGLPFSPRNVLRSLKVISRCMLEIAVHAPLPARTT